MSPEVIPITQWLRQVPGGRFLSCMAAIFIALLPAQAQVTSTPIYVLTETGGLATSTLDAPGTVSTPVVISGFTAGETLVAIDLRPQNQELYALGVNSTADTMTLYHLSAQTGLAVAVGAAVSLTTDGATVVDLPASGWDIDFNPAVDRLRVVCSSLNFRMNPNTGTLVDGDNTGLTAGSVPGTNPDGAINGATTTVQATAYVNSQPNNGNITTQYTLDASTNSIYIQNPPNTGAQTSGLTVTVSGSPLDFTAVSGFDIMPGVNAATSNAAVAAGVGYAVLHSAGTSGLYLINLVNGQATLIGNLAARSFAIRPTLGASIGLSSAGTALVRFSPLVPGTTTSVSITGVTAGETMVSLDMRPATGQVYGLGVNATADTATLYLVDPQTGASTAIGVAGQIAFVTGAATPVDFPDSSVGYDIDFNPTVDRVRVITGSGLNFRINPITGAPVDGDAGVAGTNTDGSINGLTSSVHATAYTNSFAGTGVTTQYTLDATTNSFYIQTPPNAGTQTSTLAVTDGTNPIDFSAPVGFDILGSVAVTTSNAPATGDGFFAASVGGASRIYRLNLATGVATDLGVVTGGLSSFAMFSFPVAPTVRSPLAVNLQTTSAVVGGTVTADGGSPVIENGVVISPLSGPDPVIGGVGTLRFPGGAIGIGTYSLTAAGLAADVNYSFKAYTITAAGTSYSTSGFFTLPILAKPVLSTVVVSQNVPFDLDVATGATVTATGLPSTLKLNPTTGVITGRVTTPGVYRVVFTAKRAGSQPLIYVTTFIVQALPRTAVGTFLGYIQPNVMLSGDSAGRLELTTTNQGSYSLKVIQRTKTYTSTGFLNTSVGVNPVLAATLMGGIQVALTLQSDGYLAGTMTAPMMAAQTVQGWRKTNDRVFFPASQEMGYYTVTLKRTLADAGNANVPQGSGFAGITIGEDGAVLCTGRAADNSALSCAGFLGPNQEIIIYAPLYAKLGSISGILLQVTDLGGNYTENTISGALFLTKPPTTGRTYPAALTLLQLDVQGKYLARAAMGSIVLGLPSGSPLATLDFSAGGIETSATNPDLIGTVGYLLPSFKATVPMAGGAQNPGRTSLTINAMNGSVSGSFTLVDGIVKRNIPFQGMIVRSADGSTLATGYFLAPQFPVATGPILSGLMELLP